MIPYHSQSSVRLQTAKDVEAPDEKDDDSTAPYKQKLKTAMQQAKKGKEARIGLIQSRKK